MPKQQVLQSSSKEDICNQRTAIIREKQQEEEKRDMVSPSLTLFDETKRHL